jgi:hypothetical protein
MKSLLVLKPPSVDPARHYADPSSEAHKEMLALCPRFRTVALPISRNISFPSTALHSRFFSTHRSTTPRRFQPLHAPVCALSSETRSGGFTKHRSAVLHTSNSSGGGSSSSSETKLIYRSPLTLIKIFRSLALVQTAGCIIGCSAMLWQVRIESSGSRAYTHLNLHSTIPSPAAATSNPWRSVYPSAFSVLLRRGL